MTHTVEQMLMRGGMLAIDKGLSLDQLALTWPENWQNLNEKQLAVSQIAAIETERFQIERGVAVVPIRGVLTANSVLAERYFGWTTYRGLEETCDALIADETVQKVIFEINSGGGVVIGLKAAAEAMARLSQIKTTVALIDTVGASAAYWLASQVDEITMTSGAVVGSIGVGISAAAYVQPSLSGEQLFSFTSTHARAKWPDPTTEAGKHEIARSLDETEAEFHDAIARARGISVDDLKTRLSVTDDPRDGGAIFGPTEAIARGMADHNATRAAFYAQHIGAHKPIAPAKSRAALARAGVAQALAEF